MRQVGAKGRRQRRKAQEEAKSGQGRSGPTTENSLRAESLPGLVDCGVACATGDSGMGFFRLMLCRLNVSGQTAVEFPPTTDGQSACMFGGSAHDQIKMLAGVENRE